METTPDHCRLYVDKAQRDDSGNYTITAQNPHGKDSASIEVSVKTSTYPSFMYFFFSSSPQSSILTLFPLIPFPFFSYCLLLSHPFLQKLFFFHFLLFDHSFFIHLLFSLSPMFSSAFSFMFPPPFSSSKSFCLPLTSGHCGGQTWTTTRPLGSH